MYDILIHKIRIHKNIKINKIYKCGYMKFSVSPANPLFNGMIITNQWPQYIHPKIKFSNKPCY